MITKRVLLDSICDLDNDLFALSVRVGELEKKIAGGKPEKAKAKKKTPRRPRKNK